jgi:hypothetical protein
MKSKALYNFIKRVTKKHKPNVKTYPVPVWLKPTFDSLPFTAGHFLGPNYRLRVEHNFTMAWYKFRLLDLKTYGHTEYLVDFEKIKEVYSVNDYILNILKEMKQTLHHG